VVRVRAEEFEDSPARPAANELVVDPKPLAGREPVVRYRLGGKRLSSGNRLLEEETGGLDTAGLDLEQREMLAQMQQAQELLEQDMQRLEQQRQGQHGRDTPSPQPQPQPQP